MKQAQSTSSWVPSGLLFSGVCLVFIGERVIGTGDARGVLSGLGGLLVVAALVARVRALVAAADHVRSAEGHLLGAHLGVVAGLLVYALSTDAGLDAMGLEETARSRAAGALTVLWLAIATVATSAVLFLELAYARMPVAASVELRRLRNALSAGLTLSLSAVFLLCMNYVAAERDVRKDVSYFKTTEPSGGSLGMVERLDEDVRVVLFFPRSDEVLPRVRPYFDALAAESEKLQVEVVDFDLAPELARKHRVRGNGQVLLLRGEGDEQRGQTIQIGNSLTAARPTLRKLDGLFQQHFSKLARADRKVYLTVGHGERNMKRPEAPSGDGTQVLSAILTRLNLGTKDLGLSEGLGSAVPDGSSAVVVVGPQDPFLPEEAEALLTYVREGGRVLLMLDPDVDTGLAPLLSGLGLKLLPGVVASKKHHMRRAHGPSDHALVYSNAYSSHPSVTTASRHSREVASVFVRGVGIGRTADWGKLTPRPKVIFPLRSEREFFRDLDGDFEPGGDEAEQQLNLMAVVSVTPASKKGDGSPQDDKAEGESEGRLVVIGDGDFMTDKLAANNGNMLVFVDSLAWLIGNEDLVAEVSSEEDVKIEHSREQDKLWFYGTTFAVPVPVLALGLWVAQRRRKLSEARS
ncbi:MAG: Gldg family protein [Myxococcales bacterium]|nr:Gldg family protein [Myxococcales bacterium]